MILKDGVKVLTVVWTVRVKLYYYLKFCGPYRRRLSMAVLYYNNGIVKDLSSSES